MSSYYGTRTIHRDCVEIWTRCLLLILFSDFSEYLNLSPYSATTDHSLYLRHPRMLLGIYNFKNLGPLEKKTHTCTNGGWELKLADLGFGFNSWTAWIPLTWFLNYRTLHYSSNKIPAPSPGLHSFFSPVPCPPLRSQSMSSLVATEPVSSAPSV